MLELLERERALNRRVRRIPTSAKALPPPPNNEFRVGIKRADIAYDAYNEALDKYVGNEVGVYYDDATGEYRVMVGGAQWVPYPDGDSWRSLIHYHPNAEDALRYRLPSPQDLQEPFFRLMRSPDTHNLKPVREFVEYDVPLRIEGNNTVVARGRTEFGIDPTNPEPFYIRIHLSDGTVEEPLRFTGIDEYQKFWSRCR